MKKIICCLTLALICAFTSTTPSFASTESPVDPDRNITDTGNINNPETRARPHVTKWTIQSSNYVGLVNVGGSVFFDKQQANSAGETIKAEFSRSFTGGINGELKVTKGVLTARLGFDYSKSLKVSNAKTSRPMKKKEWVYTHYQKRNKKYKVVQKGTKPGMKTAYRTVYVYRPFTPLLTMTYKK